ncbi:MAG: hemolysin [Chloroflexi bacterium]|nr:hemolysin [Chloroflexota bacterium]
MVVENLIAVASQQPGNAAVPIDPLLAAAGAGWSGVNTLQLIALLVCLALSAFANGAETALTSVSRIRTRHLLDQGVKGSQTVAFLIRDPNRFLSAILILNSVALIVGTTLATLLLVSVLGADLGAIVAPVVTSVVVLVLVEILPKTVAIHTAETTALRYAGPVKAMTIVLSPIINLLRSMTDGIMRLRGIQPRTGPFVTEEELISLVTLSEQQGVIEEEEREMIHGVIEFEETMVREVMVPRVRVTAVQANRSLQEAVDVALEDGHSRLPIYEDSIDKVTGILYVKDMLRAVRNGMMDVPLRELARKPFEVPETKRIGELFREFQAKKIHMAVVIEESGGTAGIVTIEDLLEEIVGEIQDEYDKPGSEPAIDQTAPDEYLVDAHINLEDLDDEIHLGLDSEEYDTLNGFIIDKLGALPTVGAEVLIEGAALIHVVSVTGRRADKVSIKRLAPPPAEEENEYSEYTVRE